MQLVWHWSQRLVYAAQLCDVICQILDIDAVRQLCCALSAAEATAQTKLRNRMNVALQHACQAHTEWHHLEWRWRSCSRCCKIPRIRKACLQVNVASESFAGLAACAAKASCPDGAASHAPAAGAADDWLACRKRCCVHDERTGCLQSLWATRCRAARCWGKPEVLRYKVNAGSRELMRNGPCRQSYRQIRSCVLNTVKRRERVTAQMSLREVVMTVYAAQRHVVTRRQ